MSGSWLDRWRDHRRRTTMRRRLFVWFGVTIILTAVTGIGVLSITKPFGPRDAHDRTLSLAGHRFGRVWEAPAARAELARDIADAYGADVEVHDLEGNRIGGTGSCERAYPAPRVDVVRDGKRVGEVVLCHRDRRHGHAISFWMAGGAALLVLWGMAGLLSRRLTRPLVQLERTARQLGDGNLKARVDLERRAVGEVGELARTFNEMARRLEDQVAAQRELLAAVSHEVRSPLGRIRVMLELGRSKGLDPDRIERLEREVAEIDELVAQLLAAARLDFSEPVCRPLRIGDFVADLSERSVDAPEIEDQTDNMSVVADPTLLGRALSNLLANARAHGGGGTRVRVFVRGEHLHIEVLDDGPGFGGQDTAALFQPFYRAHKAERAGSSLGLGLALVARVARAHGGEAYARDREAVGACVGLTVRLEGGAGKAAGDDRGRA